MTLVKVAAIGGRAQVFERGGFRHDAGPTVITAPFLFEKLFGCLASALRTISNSVLLILILSISRWTAIRLSTINQGYQ